VYFHLSFNAVKIQNAFGLLDQNKDGALDLKEFSKVGIPGKSDTAPCPRIITDLRKKGNLCSLAIGQILPETGFSV
jgi:Ca2+-binding EF-hand superfamily protein